MLVKTIYDAATLQNEFISMNRDYFSYEGYEALIELFEECSPQPVELDVIARRKTGLIKGVLKPFINALI